MTSNRNFRLLAITVIGTGAWSMPESASATPRETCSVCVGQILMCPTEAEADALCHDNCGANRDADYCAPPGSGSNGCSINTDYYIRCNN